MRLLIALIFLTTLTGCAFYHGRIENNVYGDPFVSTRTDFRAIGDSSSLLGPFRFIIIFDVPFSLITDIVILPYDLYVAPEYKEDKQYWDSHFSTTNTSPPNYAVLSENYSEYGAYKILDMLGREYLKHHPDYAVPFMEIAASNIEIERSRYILSRISDDETLPADIMNDACTLSISNINKYSTIIIGYIRNKATPSQCLHNITQVLPTPSLTNNRHQLTLLNILSERLHSLGKPTDLDFANMAKSKAKALRQDMQVQARITSINTDTGWITVNTDRNECLALKVTKAGTIKIGDTISGELKESGGSKALNTTNNQSFNVYVSYSGDELESTAKNLCPQTFD